MSGGLYTPAYLARLEAKLRAGLGQWGLAPDSDLRLLNVSENATYLVEDGGTGRRVVVRIQRPGYSAAEEIRSELHWIQDLRASGAVSTPAPIAGTDGDLVQLLTDAVDRHQAVAFEFVAGKEPDPQGDVGPWFQELGRLTGQLHRHARDWRAPEGFVRKAWNLETTIAPDGRWGDWQANRHLDRAALPVMRRAADLVVERIRRFGHGPEQFGLVHSDLRLANLIQNEAGLHVIDFDDCGPSWFLYDLASAMSFIEDHPAVPELVERWVQGYRSAAPLSAEEVWEIPTFLMLRRLMIVAWTESHAETPTAAEYGPRLGATSPAAAEAYLRDFG